MTNEEKLWARIEPEPNTGCWLWVGHINDNGYGLFHFGGKNERSHRVAYEMFVGPIPEGLVIDHKCRVRCCVNPDHMEVTTIGENVRRGVAGRHISARESCNNGHEFTDDNIVYKENRYGKIYRQCKICRRAQNTKAKRRWYRTKNNLGPEQTRAR